MGSAKDIILKPIPAKLANDTVRRLHYSGKVVNNSQLHIGAYYNGSLEGAMSFGPSLDKRKIQGLVRGTGWNEFIELNRMAFSEALPRNSESRAIAIAMKLLRKHAPHLKWVISFADGTQCGDGTIYRASGFVLTQIKRNTSIWEAPDGGDHAAIGATANRPGGREAVQQAQRFTDVSMRGVNGCRKKAEEAEAIVRGARFSRTSLTDGKSKRQQAEAEALVRVSRTKATKGQHAEASGGGASMKRFIEAGFRPVPGFQLRYIYFLDPAYRERLTVPELPYSAIDEAGARMYRGEKITRAGSIDNDASEDHSEEGGASPTPALQIDGAAQ